MAEKKYKLPITTDQIERLKQSIALGSPITIALAFAGVSFAQWNYMVEIASIVEYVRELKVIEENDEIVKSGVDFGELKQELENQMNIGRKSTINSFRMPNADSVLRYKNVKRFKDFADEIYNIVKEIDRLRAEIVMYHLDAVKKASHQRGMMANTSQWFLERTLPEHFGKDRNLTTTDEKAIPQVKVQFIDPNTKENKDRIKEMEELVYSQLGESNKA